MNNNYSFHTPDEVAKLFKVTPEQIRQLIRKGELSAINIGSDKKRPLYRITSEAISDFINKQANHMLTKEQKKFKQHIHTIDYFPELK